MFFIKLILGLTSAICASGLNCTQDNFYISDLVSLNSLENCTTINGNLIINTGFSVDNFRVLDNVETVSGYLFMFDNHNISSLIGLHNLKEVGGEELYLNSYSIVIKYNHNELNNTHEGLCYTNTVNWTDITSNNIDIRDNGINCPGCYPECIGCFGPGPGSCQSCLNFDYVGICLQTCPGNYTNNVCDDVLPMKPLLEGNVFGLNNIYLSWNKTNTNDYIYGFSVWLNNVLNYSYIVSDLPYYYEYLPFNYTMSDLDFETNYSIEVSFVNHLGSSNRSNSVNLVTEPRPTSTSTITTSTRTSTVSSTVKTLSTTTDTTATVITTLSIDTVNTSDDTETNNKWTNLYIIPIVIFVIIIFVISGLYCCNNNKIVPAENIIEPKTIYSYGHVGSPNFETSNDYSELERKNTEQNGRVKLNPVYSQ